MRPLKRNARLPRDGNAAPLSDQVYQMLLAEIRDGHYHPGERIKEAAVAKRLDISRTPVREAIRRLHAEGRVTIEPQRGAVVAELDRREITELYCLREELEGIAAKFAAQHASEGEIDHMEAILERSRTAADDRRELNQINWELHYAIYYAAHNRFLLRAIDAISDAMALLRGARYIPEDRPAALCVEHAAIIAAIRARDPARAERAARDHIRQSYRVHLSTRSERMQ